MSQFDSAKDYYKILGADETAPQRELDRLYKRLAARRHPDKGGSEEEMKSLNEAYRVLRNEETRREYDAQREKPVSRTFVPVSAPAARDVGLLGHGLSAFFCLLLGLFLLFLVRTHWIRFLWPLVLLSIFVIAFGVIMARNAMRATIGSMSQTNPIRRHPRVPEALFWSVVVAGGYIVFRLFTLI